MSRDAAGPPPPPLPADAAALFASVAEGAPRAARTVTAIVTLRGAEREARLLAPAVRACRARGDTLEVALLPVGGDPPAAAVEAVQRTLGVDRAAPIPPPRPRAADGRGQRELEPAYRVHAFLKPRAPDVVLSTQALGAPFFALRARESGVALRRTRFVVVLEPFELQRRLNERVVTWQPAALVLFHLERAVAAAADVCAAPSRRFVQNALRTGAAAGGSRFVVLPELDAATAADGAAPAPPAGFVVPDAAPAARNVAFFATVAARRPAALRAADGRIRLHVETRATDGALTALCRDRFAGTEVAWTVGPRAPGAASPSTVIFAPFCEDFLALGGALAPAVEGAPLIIGAGAAPGEPFEAAGVAVPPFPDAVAAALAAAAAGRRTLRVDARPADREKPWRRFFDNLAPPPDPAPAPAPPRVSVCILHFNRPALAAQAAASALAQTCAPREVLILDDGSDAPGAAGALEALAGAHGGRVRLVRGDNRYLGAARNRAARAAGGDWVYFLDDDNVLKPEAIATLVQAADASGADFVGSFSDVFTGARPPDPDAVAEQRILQAGGDAGYGLFYNAILDGNALCRRETFLALGGNTEDYGIGKDDQEFFARALHAGRRVAVVPEALLWARHGTEGIKGMHFDRSAGHFRVLEAYRPAVAPHLRGLLLLLQGMLLRQLDWNRRIGALAAGRKALLAERDRLAAERDALAAELDAARRNSPILTLARRRRGRLEAGVLLPPDWRPEAAGGGLELRRNGRAVARIDAREQDAPAVRLPFRSAGRLPGDAVYSLHDDATGAALAVVVAPPPWRARRIEGAVESLPRPVVRGWVLDPAHPARRRRVALHVDGRLRGVVTAARPRADVARWKGTDGRHGFTWPVPAAAGDGTRIDVFDAATGRPLRGSPIHIEGGRARAAGARGT